jgi:hypothetical protein
MWTQIGFAFAGTILLAASLIYSARATKAAADAADAASKTLAAERAWLTWETFHLEHFQNSTIGDTFYQNGFGIICEWKNTGRSPAINIKIHGDVRVVEGDKTSIPIFHADLASSGTAAAHLGVGGVTSISTGILSDQQAVDFRSGRVDVIIYSTVSYFDIFHPEVIRVSEACIRLQHGGGVMLRDGSPTEPIIGIPAGPQNRIT